MLYGSREARRARALVIVAATLGGCASDPSESTAADAGRSRRDAHADTTSATPSDDTGTDVVDVAPETSVDTSPAEDTATDPTDAPYLGEVDLDGCSVAGPPDDDARFVDATLGSDTSGTGTRTAPFATITRAVTDAMSAGVGHVYVAPGTYAETLVIDGASKALTISGGWDVSGTRWFHDCSPFARGNVIVQSNAAVAVTVRNATAPIVFASMTIRTKLAPRPIADGQDGESMIGVLVTKSTSQTTLHDVEVRTANAGSAGAGAPGVDGASAKCTACQDGAAGANGPTGIAAATYGSFDGSGFVPARGTKGSDGAAGHDGTAPAPAPTTSAFAGCGGCSACNTLTTPVTGNPGSCGCKGSAGTGGNGGLGGGASIGVLAVGAGASVRLESSHVIAGNGGNGSAGALGGAGGAGTFGAAGAPVPFSYGGCWVNTVGFGWCGSCGSSVGTTLLAGGTAGGRGGKGGDGGAGGGGAGGPSVGVVHAAGAIANVDASTVIEIGKGGVGAGSAKGGVAVATLSSP